MRHFCLILPVALLFARPAPAADPKPDFSLDATELAKEVLADPKAAAAKYKGKVVELSGTVSSATPIYNPRGVTLNGAKKKPNDLFALFIDCDLQPELRDKGWLLARGQKVKVTGEVAAAGADRITLTNATFAELEKNPTPSVTSKELAAAYVKDEKAANAKYGDSLNRKDVFVEGVLTDIADSQFSGYKVLKLEGHGRVFIASSVRTADAEGLKKGDTVRIKGDCRGFFKEQNMIECSGHVIKTK
jgi:hypothetical protein